MIKQKDYFNKKITIINLLATLLVVLLHSNPLLRFGIEISSEHPFIYTCYILSQTAVPTFFFVSAYLFYSSKPDFSDLRTKLKRRMHSLLIPYLIWNTIWVFVYLAMTNIPFINEKINMGVPFHSLNDIIIAIIDSRFTPLWFIKVLMVYSVCSYAILPIIKRKWLFLIVFLASLFTAYNQNMKEYDSFLLWLPLYLLGGYIGYHKPQIKRPNQQILVMLLFWVGLYIAAYVKPYLIFSFCLLTPLAIWFGYDLIVSPLLSEKIVTKKWMHCTFFIYCTHYFFINVLEKLSVLTFEPTVLVLNATFIITPIIVVASLCVVANFLSKYPIYQITTGNR